MDKLTMAHDYAMGLLAGAKTQLTTIEELVRQSWVYADLMQAESKKRQGGVPEAIADARSFTHDKDGNCLHFHHEFGHKKCMDCGASLEEWQPDWSQAPDGATSWTMRPDGKCIWWKGTPASDGERFTDIVGGCHTVGYAPNFNYQGDWRNSLRKRPEVEAERHG